VDLRGFHSLDFFFNPYQNFFQVLQQNLKLLDFAVCSPEYVCCVLILDLAKYIFSSFYSALYPSLRVSYFGLNLFLGQRYEWFHLGTSVALLALLLLGSRHFPLDHSSDSDPNLHSMDLSSSNF
jgi:hypothetical protein